MISGPWWLTWPQLQPTNRLIHAPRQDLIVAHSSVTTLLAAAGGGIGGRSSTGLLCPVCVSRKSSGFRLCVQNDLKDLKSAERGGQVMEFISIHINSYVGLDDVSIHFLSFGKACYFLWSSQDQQWYAFQSSRMRWLLALLLLAHLPQSCHSRYLP